MRADSCKQNNNYYTNMDNIKIYVDYDNSRMKIIKFDSISVSSIKKLIHFASGERLGKIICNCEMENIKNFVKAGFCLEGRIDGYFKGRDAFCMSYFVSSRRKICGDREKENTLLMKSLDISNTFIYDSNNLKYYIRDAAESDIKEMAELFSNVFFTYPSPVYDEGYLKQTMMKKKVLYKVAVYNEKIIGIASADMDKENLNAEITDCATYPKYRGKGILTNIIYFLESDLENMGFITLYSLSRATNAGVNFALSKHGYKYRGRLINNCDICGGFEDMNIWVKSLKKDL